MIQRQIRASEVSSDILLDKIVKLYDMIEQLAIPELSKHLYSRNVLAWKAN